MYGRTDGRSRDYYVTTKISRIDRLPYFLSNGAPLTGFACRLRYYDVIVHRLVFGEGGGLIIGGLLVNEIWGTSIREGLFSGVLIIGIVWYFTTGGIYYLFLSQLKE